ncbi:Lrp/AsnC family transcriptional regulator [Idiomarina loihiensis]|jgi:DNA-binding Lrp family transcriptional regulator|uniref:Leucine-responsive regulatory protein n=1 Tax=Idiomarina loihiensis (strain ATCC BAA-735 / DSM 15497 / L2-TR) TaxID=283942 RepID=Q5QV65_IDILO|nr:Lrp/AsnC family transcriptional regulator [Idiomarina loihiensis]AAV83313.1 Transcriptional regulator, Lpr family [Idiomarina loihiensis L2TR]AGM37356.1 Lpr family transcriptional regulator [Idiomarina loihiensis GSL 199]
MDKFDEKILQELKSDGRISNIKLSERIGLSPSATFRRVQELERKRVIKGYRVILDPEQLQIGFVAFVTIGLSDHRRSSQLAFEQHVADVPEVVECHNVTGTHEYLLRVEATDLKHFQRIHSNVLGECPHVNAITTMVVMESSKDQRS